MGNPQSSQKSDVHDFGSAEMASDPSIPQKGGGASDSSKMPSKEGDAIRSDEDVEFQLSGNTWVQGKCKSVQMTEKGKMYEVENYASSDRIMLGESDVRRHNSTADVWGENQLTQRSPSLYEDGVFKVVQHQIDRTRKGYGWVGWQYTKDRLKMHTKPVLICIVLCIIWFVLSQTDAFKYEDDGTLGDSSGGHHRRMLTEAPDPHSTEDPCHHRRLLSSEGDEHACVKTVPLPSDAYLVGAVISCCIVFLMMEYPGWVVMILGGTVLTLSDTIKEDDMWHAMAFPTVIACCSVTAVAKGLANTHILRIVMEKILDFNQGDFFHLTMLLMITGLLSTVVDNFAVIGIFQYVYAVFGQKTNIDSKVLMISLSYISMIGGTCTVLASGAMLVAKSFLYDAPSEDFPHISEGQKDLTMFEMSLAAFPVLFFSAPFLAWWAQFMFGSKDKEEPGEDEKTNLLEHGHSEHGFIMKYRIGSHCDVSHLHKLENASYVAKEVICKDTGKRGVSHINHDDEIAKDDIVYILAPGNKIQDLALHDFHLMEMNPFREHNIKICGHVIAEGIVDPDSEFIGVPYSEIGSHVRHWHVIGKYHPEKTYPDYGFMHEKVQGGDIMLLEGQHHALLSEHNGFIHIAEHDSGHHHDIYMFQLFVSGACLLFIIICTVLEVLTLMETVIISLLVLGQTGCLTMEEMLHKFKWKVLLLVTGAYAMANAFVDTKLAEFLTQQLMEITDSDVGMLIVMYVLSCLLSMCFPPKAGIGILYPICLTLAKKRPSLELKKLVIVVLQGTAIQLMTPNNPENSLIAEGYSFKDFFICGAPLTILSGLIFIPLLELTYGV